MKKIILLFLICITFSSCEKDETDYIVGEWKVMKVSINNIFTSDGLVDCDFNTVYDFRSDKEFRIYGPQITSDGYICMLLGAIKWEKTNNGYNILQTTNVRAEIIKVSNDTIVLQKIDGYSVNFKKMLVRQ
jgi:hypothetical protein